MYEVWDGYHRFPPLSLYDICNFLHYFDSIIVQNIFLGLEFCVLVIP